MGEFKSLDDLFSQLREDENISVASKLIMVKGYHEEYQNMIHISIQSSEQLNHNLGQLKKIKDEVDYYDGLKD